MKKKDANNILPTGPDIKLVGAWILILTIFITQLLVYTWCRVQCINLGYEISVETDNYQKLVAIQNTLKIELERLRSPERISGYAKYHLGMITPTSRNNRTLIIYETN